MACPKDLDAAARGYEIRHRDEWERTLLGVNQWAKQPLKYEELFGGASKPKGPMTAEEWEAHKARFERRGKRGGEADGGERSGTGRTVLG